MSAIMNAMRELNVFIAEKNIKVSKVKSQLKDFFHVFSRLTDYRYKPFTNTGWRIWWESALSWLLWESSCRSTTSNST